MAMTAGTQPTGYSSTLTGLSLDLYNARKSNGIYSSTDTGPITTTIDGTSYSEPTSQWQNRVYLAKLSSWVDANSLISYMTTNADISGVTVSGTVETYTAGVGLNGSSLVAGAYPAVGTVIASGLGQGVNKGKIS
jgi:hypothetical protein